MNSLIIMVGLPGAGKDTYIKDKGYKEKGYKIVSSDDIRMELFGYESQSNNKEVFEEMRKRTKECGKQKETVVYNATNLSAKRRKQLAQEMKKYFDEIIVIALETDEETILKRNEDRVERQIPVNHLKQLIRTYQSPMLSEYEYDNIVYIMNYRGD